MRYRATSNPLSVLPPLPARKGGRSGEKKRGKGSVEQSILRSNIFYINLMKIQKYQIIGLGPNSNLVKAYKESLTNLSRIQFETAIGLMLGDASLQTQNKGKTYRMKFEWGDKNKPYLDHVYSLFDQWVLAEPHKKTRINANGNTVINWGFQTISHEAFNILPSLAGRDRIIPY